MNTNSPIGVINHVPIIGIQYEVELIDGGSEFQVEYLTLDPDMIIESLCDPEDITLMALWDLLFSGTNLQSSLQLQMPEDNLLFTSFVKNAHAKMFLSSLNVILDSEIVDKLVVIKDIKAKDEYPFNGDIQ